MKEKLTIEQINSKELMGPSGPFKKKYIYANAKWYSANEGKWNAHWEEGSTIEVEVRTVTKNGRTYNNIITPSFNSSNNEEVLKKLQELEIKLIAIQEMVAKLLGE